MSVRPSQRVLGLPDRVERTCRDSVAEHPNLVPHLGTDWQMFASQRPLTPLLVRGTVDVRAHEADRVTLAPVGSEVEQELDDRWWLGLRARALASVNAHEYTMVLDFGEGSAPTIESEAIVRTTRREPETTVVAYNEDGTLSTSDALLSLIGQKVLSSVAFMTGELRLVFQSGALLTVAHGEHYEAWQLTGPSGRTWVSLPGGGLATFPSPRDPSKRTHAAIGSPGGVSIRREPTMGASGSITNASDWSYVS